jgi:hypothetical protein
MAGTALCTQLPLVGDWNEQVAERKELSGDKEYRIQSINIYSPRILYRSGVWKAKDMWSA